MVSIAALSFQKHAEFKPKTEISVEIRVSISGTKKPATLQFISISIHVEQR